MIKESGKGFSFSLKAGNGEIVAAGSKIFNDIDSVKAVIADVTASAPKAALEDQTVEGFKEEKGAKFELYSNKAGEFRFRLKAKNGEIIAVSEGYKAKASCMNGIESVKKNAPEAQIVEVEDK